MGSCNSLIFNTAYRTKEEFFFAEDEYLSVMAGILNIILGVVRCKSLNHTLFYVAFHYYDRICQ